MHKYLKFFFIFIIIAALGICTCFSLPHSTPVTLPTPPARQHVLLVPLDSRPVCTALPQKLGQLAGLNVILPPKAYLDNYKTPAQQEKILHWLQYNSKFYPYNIISTDMLLYGGLLAARQNVATNAQEDALLRQLRSIISPKKAAPPATENQQKHTAASKANSSTTYAIFSIIPRLLVSDELLPDRWYTYQLLRYSELADMVRITASFALTEKMRAVEKKIPAKILNKYTSQYEQSNRFNARLISLARTHKNMQLLIGQDDASPLGLPHVSAEKMQALIASRQLSGQAQLTYGADEIAALLLARHYLQQSLWQPKIYLYYAHASASQSVMPYMAVSTATALANQLTLLGAQQVHSPQQADIICYISCGTEKNAPGKAQAQQVQQLLDSGYKVAVIDSSEDYEPQQLLLPQLLKYNVPINKLIAYAGWNTFSNSSGTALAQAVIFAGRLQQMQQAHADNKEIISLYAQNLNFTAERILEDFYYQKTIHPALRQELAALGNDPTTLSKQDKLAAEQYIQSKLALNAFTLLHRNLGRTPFYEQDGKKYYLQSLNVSAKLPWNRIFEVDLDVWTKVGVK